MYCMIVLKVSPVNQNGYGLVEGVSASRNVELSPQEVTVLPGIPTTANANR